MSNWFKLGKNKNNGNNQQKRKKPRKDRDDLNSMKRGGSVMEDSDHEDQDNNYYNDQYQHNQQHSTSYSHSHHNDNNEHHSSSYNNNNNHNNKSSNRRSSPSRALTKSQDKLYVGDKILLANKRSGKVTSLGPKPDKEGIWVRVVMDNVHINADKMFDNNNDQRNKNKTIWVPIQRVDRIISHGKKFDLTIDDRVIERKKGIPGTIMYVGPTHFDKGVWFGVALDTPKGKNNGTVKKKFYFLSEPNHGVMLPYKRLGIHLFLYVYYPHIFI